MTEKDDHPTCPERPYDVVLFGATGFAGGLTADYLVEHLPESGRMALAGRNRDKQEQRRVETEETGGPSPVDLGAGAVGVVGLALAADELTEQEADVAYQSVEVALVEQFSADGTDPTVVGEAMAPTEATDVAVDVADSVAAAPAVSVAAEPAVATVEQEVKTGPEL